MPGGYRCGVPDTEPTRSASRRRSGLLAILLLAVVAVACTDDSSTVAGGSETPSASEPATSSPSSDASGSGSPTPPPPPPSEIEDGRHFVFVKKTSGAAVTFDLAYLLTGKEAEAAAEEAGDEVPVPNDYYIVNDNPKLRTVDVADGVNVRVYDWSVCCEDFTTISFDDFAGYVADPTDDFHGTLSPYWLRVQGGEIVKIEEQYLP